MTEFLNLWSLMRLPMQRWWETMGRWLCLPVLLLTLATLVQYQLQANMPLQKYVLANKLLSIPMLNALDRILDIPIMLLLYAFIGLWVSAAVACQQSMHQLLEESAAPSFDASPLHKLLVCYGQGLILLPVALIVYTGLGVMHAMAERVQPQVFQTAWQLGGQLSGSAGISLQPEHYISLVESISQFSASAFGIAALSLWITALAVAGGRLVGFGFLALRSLDVLILSMVLLLGSGKIFSGRPLIREALPLAEWWWCVPLLLCVILLLGRSAAFWRRLALGLLAMLALSPAFFASVLPQSMFLEDTLFARIVNSMHYMYYGIAGPVFQVKASIADTGTALRFREHLLLYTDSSTLLLTCTGSGVMLAWLGNLLVLLLIVLLVMAAVHFGVPQRRVLS